MTKKTRNFVLGAAGILAAGLTTGLVASLGLPVASPGPPARPSSNTSPRKPPPSATPTSRR